MRIRRQAWPAHSLLHRGNGIAAEDVRRLLGVSPVGRVEALEARVAELERHLALQHRHFRGVQLNDTLSQAVPDADGWLQMYSPDDTIVIQRDPTTKRNVIALSVNEEEIETGCTAAITTHVGCNAASVTATSCNAQVTHTGKNDYIAVKIGGSANAQEWDYYWAAPDAATPPGGGGGDWYSLMGAPSGWHYEDVGDPCGEYTRKIVPHWDP